MAIPGEGVSGIRIVDARKTKDKYQWGQVSNGIVHYPCHAAQLQVLSSKARFTAGIAGTGGGKSVLIPLWFAKQIQKKPKGVFLLIIPHYKHLNQSGLYDRLTEIFKAFDPKVKPVKSGSSIDYFQFGFGARLFIRSAVEPENIEGIHADALAIDEAAKVNYPAWKYGRARVDGCNGPVLIVTTPDLNNWVYTEIYRQYQAGNPDYFVCQWASSDRPGYNLEALENAKLTMSKADYDRRYGGQFSGLEGLVYETFAEHVVDTPTGQLPFIPVRFAGGIDWGWNDPLVILIGAEAQDGTIYIVEEYRGSRIPLAEVATKLKQLQRKWSKGNSRYAELLDSGDFAGFYADHSRPEIKDLMRKAGVRIKDKRVALIEAGISMVDRRLRAGFLKVFDSCAALIEEAQHYQRQQDRDGDYREKPIDKHNHSCDALRYLITGLDFNRQLNFEEVMQQEATEAAELERLKALNLLDNAEDKLKELEAKAENERLWKLAFGDLD